MTPRQPRAEATRRAILETAAAAFARTGLAGTSLNDIVRESGLTKGAFYFHFSSKEELALAAFRLKQEQLVAGMQAAVDSRAPALERLVAMLRVRVELLDEDHSLRCVIRLGQELRVGAGPGSDYAGFQELAIETLAGLLSEGREDGSVSSEVEPRRDAEFVFAAILGVDALSELMSDRKDLASRNEHMIEILRRAFGPSPVPATAPARRARRSASGRAPPR